MVVLDVLVTVVDDVQLENQERADDDGCLWEGGRSLGGPLGGRDVLVCQESFSVSSC